MLNWRVRQAVNTAVRVLKEGGMDAIKLEGGAPSRITAARAIVEAGIAVMGHVGLTPQAISVLGGFRPQGKTISSAVKVISFSSFLVSVIKWLCLKEVVYASGCRNCDGIARSWVLFGCLGVCAWAGGCCGNFSSPNSNHRNWGRPVLQWTS